MSCDNVHDLIELELDGTLPPADREALERHVAGCAACAERRVLARDTGRTFQAISIEPFPEHRSRKIMALVRELPSPARLSLLDRIAAWLTPGVALRYAALPAMAILLLVFWPGAREGTAPTPPAVMPAVPPPAVVAEVPSGPVGTLLAMSGSVALDGRPIDAETPVRSGQEIAIAGDGGRALLSYLDGTRIQLSQAARAVPRQRGLDLSAGVAHAVVARTGEGFQVDSCEMQVRVLGTRFEVDAARCRTSLLEGSIEASTASGTERLSPGETLDASGPAAVRATLSGEQRRGLLREFLRFEAAPVLAAALGTTEDSLREQARPPAPPAVPGADAVPETDAPATAATGQPSAPPSEEAPSEGQPFNPLGGLGNN